MYIITYIMVTMVTGKVQVVEYLIIKVEAVTVARDSDGLTTLHVATYQHHLSAPLRSLNVLSCPLIVA